MDGDPPSRRSEPDEDSAPPPDGSDIVSSVRDGDPSLSGSEPDEDVAPPPDGSDIRSSFAVQPIPVFDDALAGDAVTLDLVMEANYYRTPRFNDDLDGQASYESYYPRLVASYQRSHPGSRWSSSESIRFYGELDETTINLTWNSGRPGFIEFDKFLFRATRLGGKAESFVPQSEVKDSLGMIFDVLSASMATVDGLKERSPNVFDPPSQKSMDFLNAELAQVETLIDQTAQRAAQLKYVRGMLIGAAGIYVLAILTLPILLLTEVGEDHLAVPAVVGSIVAGCTGAVVSVMTRITKGDLILDYTMKNLLQPVGMFRPIVGAIFGAVVFFVLSGGLFGALDVPEEADTALYFFIALGFIAGFSERFAQDMLSTSEKQLAKATAVTGTGQADPAR